MLLPWKAMWRLLFPCGVVITVASVLFSAGPPLKIARSGTNVLFSWLQTGTNYVLEETPGLDPTNTWRSNTRTPVLAGGEYSVQEPVGPGMKFYRLRSQSTPVDAVYVSPLGDDAAPGTAEAPVFSLGRAFDLARSTTPLKTIYASRGTYPLTVPLPLVSGISLFGGFDGPPTWNRSTQYVSVISGPATAMVADNITALTIVDGFTIRAADAIAPGGSSMTVRIINSLTNVVLRNCDIVAGAGGPGVHGSPGGIGAPGGPGQPGRPGCEHSTTFPCDTCTRPAGGAGGTSSCGRTGGVGGLPGNGNAPGLAGGQGAGGTPGGPGTPQGMGGWSTPTTYWGANGVHGIPGPNGPRGAYSFTSTGVPGAGQPGGMGTPGNGGGGGGGGGGGDNDCDSYGGSGGGGGGGGCPGTPGQGGSNGGSSIAVYLWNSMPVVDSCTLTTAGGADGGNGGDGGPGGNGGPGGAINPYGGSTEQDDGSNGGRGGDGGRGGNGGHGGGGGGGLSVGILLASGNAPLTLRSNAFVIGPSGNGGRSLGNSGLAGARANVYAPQ